MTTGIFDPPEGEPKPLSWEDIDLSVVGRESRTARWYIHPDTYQRCLDEFAHAERVYKRLLKKVFKDFRPV